VTRFCSIAVRISEIVASTTENGFPAGTAELRPFGAPASAATKDRYRRTLEKSLMNES
jgi:hypothetical protein